MHLTKGAAGEKSEGAGKECDTEWREVETTIGFQLGSLNEFI